MKEIVITFSICYLALLFILLYFVRSKKTCESTESTQFKLSFLFEGGKVGTILSIFGISATLFSTFTLMGMPDFFRNHGITAWVFLGVTDVCLAAIMLSGGLWLRRVASGIDKNSHFNITQLLIHKSVQPLVIWFYVLASTIFLLPYITIQVKGVAMLYQAVVPVGISHFFWSCAFVGVVYVYSYFGGMKAIYWTDFIQGIILFAVVYIISFTILEKSGGLEGLFSTVAAKKPELLTPPGPAGLLGVQFLLLSFLSICSMPFVQPQLATRVLLVDSNRNFAKVTMGLGFFAFFVILPSLVIGLRSIGLPGTHPGGFLTEVLSTDLPPWMYAAFLVGVVSAGMSTIDSQLFAVGTEWATILKKGHSTTGTVKTVTGIMATMAILLAQSDFKSLVLFSLNSFIGTSLLLPILIASIIDSKWKMLCYFLSIGAVFMFIGKLFQFVDTTWLGMRMELWLYLVSWGVPLLLHTKSANQSN